MIQIRDDSRWNRRSRSENLPQISRRGWENIEEKVSRTFLSVRPLCFLALAQGTTFFMSNQTLGTRSPFDASKILAKYLPISCLKRRRRWKKNQNPHRIVKQMRDFCAISSCLQCNGIVRGSEVKDVSHPVANRKKERKVRRKSFDFKIIIITI